MLAKADIACHSPCLKTDCKVKRHSFKFMMAHFVEQVSGAKRYPEADGASSRLAARATHHQWTRQWVLFTIVMRLDQILSCDSIRCDQATERDVAVDVEVSLQKRSDATRFWAVHPSTAMLSMCVIA